MKTLDFNLTLLPVNVRFGAGRRNEVAGLLKGLAATRPLLIGTPAARDRYADVWAATDSMSPAVFFEAEAHCPIDVVERCREQFRDSNADSVVAVGGGSTLGLGKILAAEEGARFVALPTTYSGSEMTPLFGRKIGDEKRVKRDAACRPHAVIYDPELTRDLPRDIVATSGMNSLAHVVEALYSQSASPFTDSIAADAMQALRVGLAGMVGDGRNSDAASQAMYGGFLGGMLVAACGIALHHQICHVIGGLYDLPHGATNAVVLPHAFAYNASAVPEACAMIHATFGGPDAATGLYEFARSIGAPKSLAELGMPESGIDPVVAGMLAHGGWNPRALHRDALTRMVTNAWHGTLPVTDG